MSEPDLLLAAFARRQHGVFTLAQARDLGLSRKAIRVRCDGGRWRQLSPGVVVIDGAPITWHTKVMAACLATGGIASHRTAAVLYEVRDFRPGRVEVTANRGIRRRLPSVTVHQSKDLRLCEPVMIHGIPTSTPARLLVDLGAVTSFPRFEAAVDDLIGRRLVTWDEALLVLQAHSRQGRHGCGPLRALLEERYGEHLPESVLERVFLSLVRERGFEEPVPQHEIHDRRGFVARVDFAYPDARVAIELDSVRYHLDAETFERDHEKRARLTAAGWTVLAFTWHMVVDHPGRVAEALRRVLVAAA